MPAEFLVHPVSGPPSGSQPSHFLSEMERRFGELPYFLHNTLSSLFGLQDISVRDVFWAGGIREAVDPYFTGAVFLVVDRKRKIPRPALSCPKWAQPVYVLQQRDGSYLCGFCTLQNGTLILRSCFAGTPTLQRLRNRVDAEVVGKVVGDSSTAQVSRCAGTRKVKKANTQEIRIRWRRHASSIFRTDCTVR